MIPATRENITGRKATAPLTAWLIAAAKAGSKLTYQEAKQRLEQEQDFDTIFTTEIGVVAGTAMDNILEGEPSAPLLNVLLVRKDTGLPGRGAAGYLARRFPDEPWLNNGEDPSKHQRWMDVVDRAARAVYAYTQWDHVYKRIYYDRLPDSKPTPSAEKDGLRYGRKGEGKNHKALRLWAQKNPSKICKRFHGARAETEYSLLSGDRVDVVYISQKGILAIEVKSEDSSPEDIRRGIYQCVKYQAVLRAMPIGRSSPVESWLVTESDIGTDLKAEARILNVKCLQAPPSAKW